MPSSVPRSLEHREVACRFWTCSEGTESSQGRWASGPSPDGKGGFECLPEPRPMTDDVGLLDRTDPRLYGTPRQPVPKQVAEQAGRRA